jgi:hypothetical protein
MYLFELEGDSEVVPQIVALTNQLEQEVDDGEIDPDNYTLAELQDYFQDYDIILDDQDIYNMIKVPPLKDLISNIKDGKVIFKGHADNSNAETTEKTDDTNKQTVAKMAHKAMK